MATVLMSKNFGNYGVTLMVDRYGEYDVVFSVKEENLTSPRTICCKSTDSERSAGYWFKYFVEVAKAC